MTRPVSSQPDIKNELTDPDHRLVGTWIEVENSIADTTVVYTITVNAGRFCVSGIDESDGVSLRVSHVSWDGEKLRFMTLFVPTMHEAKHEFWLRREGVAAHTTAYSDEHGQHTVNEIWKKRT